MSNQYIKKRDRIEIEKLCYICEEEPGTIIDEVNGRLCQGCHKGVQAMRLKYAEQGGYTRKSEGDGHVRG